MEAGSDNVDMRELCKVLLIKFSIAKEELAKCGVVVPGLESVRADAINHLLDQVVPVQNNRLDLEVSRLTRQLAVEGQEKKKYKDLSVKLGVENKKLQDKINDMEAHNDEDDDESGDGSEDGESGDGSEDGESGDESDGSNEYARKVRALINRRDALEETVGRLKRELKDALAEKNLYVNKFTDADTKYKNASGHRNMLAAELDRIKKDGIDAETTEKIAVLERRLKSELDKVKMLTADIKKYEKTASHEKAVADGAIAAFGELRDEFVANTGREPKTRIPNEDAMPDSGDETHPNVDGRKRGRRD